MNTLHDNNHQPTEHETEMISSTNRFNKRLKLAAAACVLAIPVGMYADDAIDTVQESLELHVDPNVLDILPAE